MSKFLVVYNFKSGVGNRIVNTNTHQTNLSETDLNQIQEDIEEHLKLARHSVIVVNILKLDD